VIISHSLAVLGHRQHSFSGALAAAAQVALPAFSDMEVKVLLWGLAKGGWRQPHAGFLDALAQVRLRQCFATL
jgi:hypothetical protein